MSVFKKLFAADRTSTPSQPPRRFPFNKADMQPSRLDPRLRAMQPLLEELMALRAYLHALRAASLSHAASPSAMASDAISQPGQGRPSFWLYTKWLDDAIDRVTSQMHERFWPPIHLRLNRMAIGELARGVHRSDADGYLREIDPKAPWQSRYIAEREKILQWVDRIDRMFTDIRAIK